MKSKGWQNKWKVENEKVKDEKIKWWKSKGWKSKWYKNLHAKMYLKFSGHFQPEKNLMGHSQKKILTGKFKRSSNQFNKKKIYKINMP